MESLIVNRDINNSDIECYFEKVINNESIKLRLPNGFQEQGAFGIEGLICQLIATWIRNHRSQKILHTYSKGSESHEFESLCTRLYGIIALRLCDEIWTDKKEIVSREVALHSAYQRIKYVIDEDFSSAFKGLYVAIPSIKADASNKEFNNPFYFNDHLVSSEKFRDIINKILKTVVPQTNRLDHIEDFKPKLTSIIFELFENTHLHARSSGDGKLLSKNFRSVIFNSVEISKERLEELGKGSTAGMLSLLVDWNNWIERNNRNIPILDVTVVDAGPGFAKCFLGKSEITIEEEKKALLECFKKNRTSSYRVAAGSGLNNVIADLKTLRGWFRLRTGSFEVTKSFFLDDDSIHIEEKNIVKKNSFVEGASFNFVIPLVDIVERESKDV